MKFPSSSLMIFTSTKPTLSSTATPSMLGSALQYVYFPSFDIHPLCVFMFKVCFVKYYIAESLFFFQFPTSAFYLGFLDCLYHNWASLVAQTLKNPPAVYSSILPEYPFQYSDLENPMNRETGQGLQRVGYN